MGILSQVIADAFFDLRPVTMADRRTRPPAARSSPATSGSTSSTRWPAAWSTPLPDRDAVALWLPPARRGRPARRVRERAGRHHRPAGRPVRGVRRGAGDAPPGHGGPPAPGHPRRPPRAARARHRYRAARHPPRHARRRWHPRVPGSLQPDHPPASTCGTAMPTMALGSNCPADPPSTPCGASPTIPTTWETTRERPAGR